MLRFSTPFTVLLLGDPGRFLCSSVFQPARACPIQPYNFLHTHAYIYIYLFLTAQIFTMPGRQTRNSNGLRALAPSPPGNPSPARSPSPSPAPNGPSPGSPPRGSGLPLPELPGTPAAFRADATAQNISDILDDQTITDGDTRFRRVMQSVQRDRLQREDRIQASNGHATLMLSQSLADALSTNSRVDRMPRLTSGDSRDIVKSCNFLRRCATLVSRLPQGPNDYRPALHGVRDASDVEAVTDLAWEFEPADGTMAVEVWQAFCLSVLNTLFAEQPRHRLMEITATSPPSMTISDSVEKEILAYTRIISAADWYARIDTSFPSWDPQLRVSRWLQALPDDFRASVRQSILSLPTAQQTLQRTFNVTRDFWPQKRRRMNAEDAYPQHKVMERQLQTLTDAVTSHGVMLQDMTTRATPAAAPPLPPGPPPVASPLLALPAANAQPIASASLVQPPVSNLQAVAAGPLAMPNNAAIAAPQLVLPPDYVAGTGKSRPRRCRACPGNPTHSMEDCPDWLSKAHRCYNCGKTGHIRAFCPFPQQSHPNGFRR